MQLDPAFSVFVLKTYLQKIRFSGNKSVLVENDCFFLKLYFFIAILHQNTVEYTTCKSFLFILQKESLDSIQRYFAFADLSIV